MSNAIPPALTAEEWVTKWRAGSDPGFLPMRSAWLHEYADADGVWNSLSLAGLAGAVTVNRPDMHAVAALCLHEQPFGFTDGMSIRLQEAANAFRGGRLVRNDDTVPDERERSAFLSRLADDMERIRAVVDALLPPVG